VTRTLAQDDRVQEESHLAELLLETRPLTNSRSPIELAKTTATRFP